MGWVGGEPKRIEPTSLSFPAERLFTAGLNRLTSSSLRKENSICPIFYVSRFGFAVKHRLVNRKISVRFCFGFPFSSKVPVYGHCLVTVPLPIYETLKWLIPLPLLMQKLF